MQQDCDKAEKYSLAWEYFNFPITCYAVMRKFPNPAPD